MTRSGTGTLAIVFDTDGTLLTGGDGGCRCLVPRWTDLCGPTGPAPVVAAGGKRIASYSVGPRS